MKRLILTILFSAPFCSFAGAQPFVDTLSTPVPVQEDSLLIPETVFGSMPSNVQVTQSQEVRSAMYDQMQKNSKRLYNGFRIRLYFDSCQTARNDARMTVERFRAAFPDIPVYHKFESPFFVVMAGDFRTKADAEEVLESVKSVFPSAVVVRAKFKYPSVM